MAARIAVPEHSPSGSCLAVSALDFGWGCHSRGSNRLAWTQFNRAYRWFIKRSWLIIGMYVEMATYVKIYQGGGPGLTFVLCL